MDKIENLANKYVERHIRDRHLSDDTIKEIKIAYIMIIKDFIAIVDKSTSMNEDDIIYVVNNISSILYEPVEISNTDKKILEIGIALGLKGAISCIFGSLLKDDCNIKDEIIDISKQRGRMEQCLSMRDRSILSKCIKILFSKNSII